MYEIRYIIDKFTLIHYSKFDSDYIYPPWISKTLHYFIRWLLGCSCIFSAVMFSLLGWQQQGNSNGVLEATSLRGGSGWTAPFVYMEAGQSPASNPDTICWANDVTKSHYFVSLNIKKASSYLFMIVVVQICHDGFLPPFSIKAESCGPPTLQPAERREATLARISPSRGGQHPMGCPFDYCTKISRTPLTS